MEWRGGKEGRRIVGVQNNSRAARRDSGSILGRYEWDIQHSTGRNNTEAIRENGAIISSCCIISTGSTISAPRVLNLSQLQSVSCSLALHVH